MYALYFGLGKKAWQTYFTVRLSFDFCLLFILYDRWSILYKCKYVMRFQQNKTLPWELRRNFLCCRLPLSDGKGLVGIGRRPSPFFSSSLFYPVSSHFLFAPASSRKPVHRLQTPGRPRTISFAWKSVEKNVSVSIPRACTLMMARFRCVLFHVSPHGVSSKRGTPTSQRMANLQKIRDIE